MSGPAFSREEYAVRQTKTRQAMADAGLDVLVVTEPANMCYLTGYDGWSFYTPQCLLVAGGLDEPVLIVRGMDANAGPVTTYLPVDNILGYPDHLVQQPDRHPSPDVPSAVRPRPARQLSNRPGLLPA